MSAESNEAIIYECPHCHEKVEVGQELFDQTVDCPKCDAPFHAEPRKASPTGEAADHPRFKENEARLSNEETTEMVIHPVVFRRHIFGTLFAIIGLIMGIVGLITYLNGAPLFGFDRRMVAIPATILLIVSLFVLLRWLIISRMHTLTLTNERLIYRYGIIQRDTNELRHDDIRNMQVDQNLLERLLNFGDMSISSAGQDNMEIVVNDVPDPQQVLACIRKYQ